MASIGIVLKYGLGITKKVPLLKHDSFSSQKRTLTKLLTKAQNTYFGQEYNFQKILQYDDKVKVFREQVPVFTYETIFASWWKTSLQGEPNVCWPGKVQYFALSSGTSTGSSKYIPVTQAMLRSIQRASVKQILSLANCNLPENFYEKGILMLGGSTNLEYNGIHYAGDLSGITTGRLPFWFQPFYKPGKGISQTRNWQDKLDLITREAHKWDIGSIVGVPSWFQLLIERIIEYHKVKNIHEIWPNLMVFTHGGVSFDPYKKSFEKLLGKPLIYLETYLASEGFIAYQDHPDANGMKLLVRNGIYYEFIPFNDENVDEDGNLSRNAQALSINEVEENKDYVLLMSTCAGAWRYVIGDVIRFVSIAKREIHITGRTKHFLSMCGEHLSVDNMNKAIEMVSENLNINIKEFTVAGIAHDGLFAHQWYISVEEGVDIDILRRKLDFYIKELNDDYRVEREHVLKNILVDVIPHSYFLDWLKEQGKEGAQVKFPRVLKKAQLESWQKFLSRRKIGL
jgi:hypothetical protein